MPDLLVKLYELPKHEQLLNELAQKKIVIRKPIGPENYAVIKWISEKMGSGWAAEAETAFFNNPKTLYIAVSEDENGPRIIGFACYDATSKGFFGPTGVEECERGKGIGKALLLACLHGMAEDGYGYAVIGGVGPVAFYEKACGATMIEGSDPGIYRGFLHS